VLSAQVVLSSLKSLAEKHISVLYDDTKFVGKATNASAIGKAHQIIVRYCRSSLISVEQIGVSDLMYEEYDLID
jgi:hypothetical protein